MKWLVEAVLVGILITFGILIGYSAGQNAVEKPAPVTTPSTIPDFAEACNETKTFRVFVSITGSIDAEPDGSCAK